MKFFWLQNKQNIAILRKQNFPGIDKEKKVK